MASVIAKPSSPPQRLYFAYGSNLSLAQMAVRCPQSRYLGFARLAGYRWQINERGYANVVPSPGDCVEGLVYILAPEDEARLDVNEGVPWAYEKVILEVEVLRSFVSKIAKEKVVEIVETGLRELLRWEGDELEAEVDVGKTGSWEAMDTLVYVSRSYVTDNLPKLEYMGRINRGVEDALLLGVSQGYVGRYIRPFIPAA